MPLVHKRIEASEIWEKRNPDNFRGWLAKRRNLSIAETARMSEGFFGTSDLKLLEKGTSGDPTEAQTTFCRLRALVLNKETSVCRAHW
jgi:hypothetical protein